MKATLKHELISAYSEMITQRIEQQWDACLLTFTFEEIPGPERRVTEIMRREVERVYATLLTRIARCPRRASTVHRLPVWIGGPDFPVPKHERSDKRLIIVNDGQHVHVVAATPPQTRLRCSLRDHLEDNQSRYLRGPLFQIHAVEVDRRPDYVLQYALKAIESGRVSIDHLILLPRALSELSVGRFAED